MNVAQWQGWAIGVLSFNLAEPVSYRALLKSTLKENVHKGKGGRK